MGVSVRREEVRGSEVPAVMVSKEVSLFSVLYRSLMSFSLSSVSLSYSVCMAATCTPPSSPPSTAGATGCSR